jgi:hypothetical protein
MSAEQKIIITISSEGNMNFAFEPQLANNEEEFNKLSLDEQKVQSGASKLLNAISDYIGSL